MYVESAGLNRNHGRMCWKGVQEMKGEGNRWKREGGEY